MSEPLSRAERFWAKVEKTAGCWLWTGALAQARGGYGHFWNGQRTMRAHRYAYELLVGPIPAELTIDHLCRNPACVNPAHLEAVTQRENTLRGVSPAIAVHLSGRCGRGHERSPENTTFRRGTTRVVYCKVCRRERRRAHRDALARGGGQQETG